MPCEACVARGAPCSLVALWTAVLAREGVEEVRPVVLPYAKKKKMKKARQKNAERGAARWEAYVREQGAVVGAQPGETKAADTAEAVELVVSDRVEEEVVSPAAAPMAVPAADPSPAEPAAVGDAESSDEETLFHQRSLAAKAPPAISETLAREPSLPDPVHTDLDGLSDLSDLSELSESERDSDLDLKAEPTPSAAPRRTLCPRNIVSQVSTTKPRHAPKAKSTSTSRRLGGMTVEASGRDGRLVREPPIRLLTLLELQVPLPPEAGVASRILHETGEEHVSDHAGPLRDMASDEGHLEPAAKTRTPGDDASLSHTPCTPGGGHPGRADVEMRVKPEPVEETLPVHAAASSEDDAPTGSHAMGDGCGAQIKAEEPGAGNLAEDGGSLTQAEPQTARALRACSPPEPPSRAMRVDVEVQAGRGDVSNNLGLVQRVAALEATVARLCALLGGHEEAKVNIH
ncbi:hypothetical protein PsYK624_137810 [Phanerochaete sordida]|uniref:Uncharacterized protein n=1 Tax=Phanerochaete sordida TaxID=48140 RepID=A0A9P3GQ91_9APHY|nr:hypothetical protein PsYK624_137810 [Phanerochaete sordida]